MVGGARLRKISSHHFARIPVQLETALVQPQSPSAQLRHRAKVVADQHDRASFSRYALDSSKTPTLKFDIPHCEHFVDKQDFRPEMSRHGERKTQIHSRRV